MSLLTLEPRARATSPSSSHPGTDRSQASTPGNRPAIETGRGAGGAAEFARLLGGTLLFYAALIVAPMLALVPIALLGLVLGLIGAAVGG